MAAVTVRELAQAQREGTRHEPASRPGTPDKEPVRPWLIYVDGELYGDYRTDADQHRALSGAAASGGEVMISHWDSDGYRGPGWTDPGPVTIALARGGRGKVKEPGDERLPAVPRYRSAERQPGR